MGLPPRNAVTGRARAQASRRCGFYQRARSLRGQGTTLQSGAGFRPFAKSVDSSSIGSAFDLATAPVNGWLPASIFTGETCQARDVRQVSFRRAQTADSQQCSGGAPSLAIKNRLPCMRSAGWRE
jgi:hypothetical protein